MSLESNIYNTYRIVSKFYYQCKSIAPFNQILSFYDVTILSDKNTFCKTKLEKSLLKTSKLASKFSDR